MFSSKLYKQLPVSFQEYYVSSRALVRKILRENRLTWSILSKLNKSQWMDESEIEKFQLESLRKVLGFAETRIPFYRDQFQKMGFDSRDITKPSNIENLPFLTKEIVRENAARLILDFPTRILGISGHTGGTTGTPLNVYQNPLAIILEQAFLWRQSQWAGYNRKDKKIWLRGDMIVPARQNRPPYWRYNRADNQMIMSSYHISDKSLPAYIKTIRDFFPALIEAYPSSIFPIASFMKNNGYQPIKVGCIITTSETLFPEQRQIIEQMFSCKVFDWYGGFERVAAIGTCQQGDYHIIEDYGYTELFEQNDGLKEIVSTGFNNSFMPLIRYKTGDLVRCSGADKKKCYCGRDFRMVESIVGRMDEYIMLPDGRRVQRLHFIFKGGIAILESQIYQHRDYLVELRIVPDKGFSKKHENKIISNAKERLGSEIPIKVVCVKKIPRTKNGKLQMVISELLEGIRESGPYDL